MFARPEPDVLAALFETRRVRGLSEPHLRRAADLLDGTLERVLSLDGSHDVAIDMAGFVAAEAYGTLPMPEPPVQQLEAVFDSGLRSGAVRGMFGVAWRVLYLVAALPYLGWPHRAKADAELARRLPDLAGKLEGAVGDGQQAESLGVSQRARLGWLAHEIGSYVPEERVVECGNQLIRSALELSDGERALPTGVAAQVALAAHVAGERTQADDLLADLVRERTDPERGLLYAEPEGPNLEMSPWVALALLQSTGPVAPQVRPRRLRDLLVKRRPR